MIPHDLFYAHPGLIILLALLPVFIFLCVTLAVYRYRLSRSIAIKALRPKVVAKRSLPTFWVRTGMLCLAWTMAVIALMEPKGNAHYPKGSRENVAEANAQPSGPVRRPKEVIFVLDDSASMTVKDMRGGVSRFDIAKDIVDQIVSHLNGQNVSLYAFTNDTDKVIPASTDYFYLRFHLRNMQIDDIGAPGTDMKKTFEALADDYEEVSPVAYKYLVFLSDGGDTGLEDMPQAQQDKGAEALIKPLEKVKGKWRYYVVGMGTTAGGVIPGLLYKAKTVHSVLDPHILKALIHKNGQYIDGNSEPPLLIGEKIAKEINDDAPFLTPDEASSPNLPASAQEVVYDNYFQYPLFAALLCLLLAILLPDRWRWEGNK